MVKDLSNSEQIVIKNYFRNPCIDLEDLAILLENYRQKTQINDGRIKTKVDVRSVSKFKSLGLKKIRNGLEKQAETLKLDLTFQNSYDFNGNQLKKKDIKNLKKWGGILIGFDYRVNTQVYVIYTLTQGFVVYYEHSCNSNCQKQCKSLLQNLITERNLSIENKSDSSTLKKYKQAIFLIAKKLRKCI